MDIESIRMRVEALERELAEEYYQHCAGFKTALDSTSIY